MVFYFWSIIALIWFILFVSKSRCKSEHGRFEKQFNLFTFSYHFPSQTVTCYNDPESHPFITDKELAYLKKEMGQTKRNDNLPPTPWRSILTSVPVWALVIAQVMSTALIRRRDKSYNLIFFYLNFRSDTTGSFTSCQPICRNTWKTSSNSLCMKLAFIRRCPIWACGSFRSCLVLCPISWSFAISLRLHKHAKYSPL